MPISVFFLSYMMRKRKYVNVALRKEIVDQLNNVDPNRALESLVSEAVTQFITNKRFRVPDNSLNISPIQYSNYNYIDLPHRITQ